MGVAVVADYVAGEWRPADALRTRYSPVDGEPVSESSAGSAETAIAAVEAARTAFPQWSALSAQARGAFLVSMADRLGARADVVATDLTREEGKTIVDAHGEVGRAIGILRFFGGLGMHPLGEVYASADAAASIWTMREPRGAVALITPWNFPIAIPAWKLAPALMAGNTVILKPAEWAPRTAAHLAECAHEAGVPAGVLNVVFGAGGVVGQQLVGHPDVAAVSFTGSTATGLHISTAVAPRAVPVQLEMGGKNAVVVLEDADPRAAADIVARGGWGQTGQTCTATSRVIGVGTAYDNLLAALAEQSPKWAPGDPFDTATRMGPVVHEEQLRGDLAALDRAATGGATLAFGGSSDGLRLSPALLEMSSGPGVWREEIFGPIIGAARASGLDEAIALANDSDYGLVAGIVTNDFAAITAFSRESRTGLVKVNQPTSGLELHVPFGGTKASSNGAPAEQGRRAVDFYSKTKTVYQAPLTRGNDG